MLITEAARRELVFPETISFKSGSEKYEDIGMIRTGFHDFDSNTQTPTAPTARNNLGTRYRESFRLFLKLWFAPFAGKKEFNNLPASSRHLRQAGFAVLTALLTPLFVPVSAVLLVFHALKPAG